MSAHRGGRALSVAVSPFIFASHVYASDPITSAVLDPLQSKADEVIDRATRNGDTLAKAIGEEIRNGIQAWKRANSSLLYKAFSDLDKQERKTFRDMQALIVELDQNGRVLGGMPKRFRQK
jgi:hypothetical protein